MDIAYQRKIVSVLKILADAGKPLGGTRIAQKLQEYGVDLICLKLLGPDPAGANVSAADAAKTVKSVLEAVDVPLIIWGCGDEDKDNEVMPECSQAAKGENCLLGAATESNYRTMGAVGTADKHKLIGEAPVDINIAKQVNILLQDAGFDLKDVVMCQVTAALGYGFDYVYNNRCHRRNYALLRRLPCDRLFDTIEI